MDVSILLLKCLHFEVFGNKGDLVQPDDPVQSGRSIWCLYIVFRVRNLYEMLYYLCLNFVVGWSNSEKKIIIYYFY